MKGIIIQFFIYAFDNTNLHLLIVQATQLYITKFNMLLNIIFVNVRYIFRKFGEDVIQEILRILGQLKYIWIRFTYIIKVCILAFIYRLCRPKDEIKGPLLRIM